MHAGLKPVLSWQLRSSVGVFRNHNWHFRSSVHATMSIHDPAESAGKFDHTGQPIASFFAPWQHIADTLLVCSLRYHQGGKTLSAVFHAV